MWVRVHLSLSQIRKGDRGSTAVKVLCYKSEEGHWIDPSWCQWIFHWHNPSDHTMALGSTHPLTQMSTRSISCGKGGRILRLTTYHHPVALSRNLGTLTSWNPLGHSRPVMGLLYPLQTRKRNRRQLTLWYLCWPTWKSQYPYEKKHDMLYNSVSTM